MKVLGKEIPGEVWRVLVSGVKEKKQLAATEDKIVEELLEKELQKDSKLVDFFSKAKAKTVNRSGRYEELVKKIRSILHRSYGTFQTKGFDRREKILNELRILSGRKREIAPTIELHKELLRTHKSTAERLNIYQELYWKLWEIVGKPRRIIDLGAGLNPLSFPWMGLWLVEYLAIELNQADCDFLNNYFDVVKYYGLKGLAIPMDLTKVAEKPELLSGFPRFDVAFLFKLTDSLEHTQSHKISEEVMKAVPADWLIVSFSTKTLSKKPMNSTRHVWIEKTCQRLGWDFKKLTMKSESFYIIRKGRYG